MESLDRKLNVCASRGCGILSEGAKKGKGATEETPHTAARETHTLPPSGPRLEPLALCKKGSPPVWRPVCPSHLRGYSPCFW